MGFGYNPDLSSLGERLDILNFYAWMKRFQDELSPDWIIYDASGYTIVNRIPKKKITKLGDKPSAEQVLDVIVSEQDEPKRQEIMRNCELRSQYLQKLIGITGIRASYIDSREVFREESEYQVALDISLEFVERLKTDNPNIVEKTIPLNSNPASRLYLPLEIAEALYLQNKFGVGGKFGPKTEEFFDLAILGVTTEEEIPYQTIRCPYGPRRPGYLSDKNVIWTQSLDSFILEVLDSDREYRNFVGQYLEPFRKNGESLEENVMRIRDKIKLEEVL